MKRIRSIIGFAYAVILGVVAGLSLIASVVMTVRNLNDLVNSNLSSAPLALVAFAVFVASTAALAALHLTDNIFASIFIGAILFLPFMGGILLDRYNYTIPDAVEIEGAPVFNEVDTRELDCSPFNLLEGKYKTTFPRNAAFVADDSSVLMVLAVGPAILVVDNYGDFETEAVLSGQVFVIPFANDGHISGMLEIGNCSTGIVYRYMRVIQLEIEIFPDFAPEQRPTEPPYEPDLWETPEPTRPPAHDFDGVQG